jgi:hypothetical protein
MEVASDPSPLPASFMTLKSCVAQKGLTGFEC